MKRIIKAAIFIAVVTVASTASCASLKDNYGACLSKDLLNQLFDAHNNKDEKAWAWLMKNGCVLTKKEWQISVIDFGFATSKIRVYVDDKAIVLWTDTSSIKP